MAMPHLPPHSPKARRVGKPDPRVVTPPDTPEGVFEEFRALTRRLLSVPKAVIDKREREYRKRRRRS